MADAIIVAAGSGDRFGGGQPKQFANLSGKPVLLWSVEVLSSVCDATVVVAAADQIDRVRSLVPSSVVVVEGGATRQESVRLGLAALSDASTDVLVHDAARPCLSSEFVCRILEALADNEAVVPALPVSDTLVLSRGDTVDAIVDRAGVHGVQTPQAFRIPLLRQAHRRAEAGGFTSSDDGSLVLAMDKPVHRIAGDPLNIKISVESDLRMAEAIISQSVQKR
jgi:2-C-methyl-D-erythritol 4-phosphate cytidylyltransferase